MFDFVSFSLELSPTFKFHSLWLSGDIYSVFQGNCIYHSADMCLERNFLVKDPYFALKTVPAYPPHYFFSCGSKCVRTFF